MLNVSTAPDSNKHEQLTKTTSTHDENSRTLLSKAIQEAEKGNGLVALIYLKQVPKEEKNALHLSYVGYCLAKEHQQFSDALALCKKSIRQAPQDPVCYLNLGRVCLITGHKQHAIKAFRQSLKVGCLPQVVSELQQLENTFSTDFLVISSNRSVCDRLKTTTSLK
ncbi:MAG: tetratricopeptide repeat protein [Desulfuromonas sp.]|nr:tetratricopeptide repeat protein [Desulfuromonas sp.]